MTRSVFDEYAMFSPILCIRSGDSPREILVEQLESNRNRIDIKLRHIAAKHIQIFSCARRMFEVDSAMPALGIFFVR